MADYTGKALRKGSQGRSVKEMQRQLQALGFNCGPTDGEFGDRTRVAVVEFQARHDDYTGTPLVVDGVVGPLTWAALFRTTPAPPTTLDAASALSQHIVRTAQSEIGNHEEPDGSNYGNGVTKYVNFVGSQEGLQWCQAFAWWCAFKAGPEVGIPDPKARWRSPSPSTCTTAKWAKDKGWFFAPKDVLDGQAVVMPGDFVYTKLDFSAWVGHVGIVEQVDTGYVHTIEGNSENAVRQRTHRLMGLAGFVRLR
jgi:hypothetical protein